MNVYDRLGMAGRSDQIAIPIPIGSDRIVKKKIDRMIAIPLDQFYFFKIYIYAF